MNFVQLVHDRLDELAENCGLSSKILADAYEKISSSYAKGQADAISRPEQVLAYALARMPATMASFEKIGEELSTEGFFEGINAHIDLGSGPGTALWALRSCFHEPKMVRSVVIERQAAFLAFQNDLNPFPKEWGQAEPVQMALGPELPAQVAFSAESLVTAGWVFNELPPETALSLWDALLDSSAGALLILEPGTPKAAAFLSQMRDKALQKGEKWALWGPCPHRGPCPLLASSPQGRWCHFAARVARSRFHKAIKGGDVGWEDEKFTWLALARRPRPPFERLLESPRIHGGHGQFTLCAPGEAIRRTHSRREGELWKRLRKAEWGESFPKEP